MFILALDLSTKNTGWAVGLDGQLLESGEIAAKGKDLTPRIIHMRNEIKKILEKYNSIEKVIIEDIRVDYKNAKTYKALSWMQGIIAILLYEMNPETELIYFQPSAWRSKLGIKTGKGIKREELKQQDIMYVQQNHPEIKNIKSDDEADAICIFDSYWIEGGFFSEK